MKREEGLVGYVVLGVILLIGSLFAVGRHHNGGGTSRYPSEAIELGCQGVECSASPVPEPVSGLLLAVGGVVVGYAVRRKLS